MRPLGPRAASTRGVLVIERLESAAGRGSGRIIPATRAVNRPRAGPLEAETGARPLRGQTAETSTIGAAMPARPGSPSSGRPAADPFAFRKATPRGRTAHGRCAAVAWPWPPCRHRWRPPWVSASNRSRVRWPSTSTIASGASNSSGRGVRHAPRGMRKGEPARRTMAPGSFGPHSSVWHLMRSHQQRTPNHISTSTGTPGVCLLHAVISQLGFG